MCNRVPAFGILSAVAAIHNSQIGTSCLYRLQIKKKKKKKKNRRLLCPCLRCIIPSPKAIGPLVLQKISKGFYNIWVWRPSWSCDPDPHTPNKLSFPRPMEAPHEILLRFVQQYWRRCLKLVDDGRTDDDGRRSLPIL